MREKITEIYKFMIARIYTRNRAMRIYVHFNVFINTDDVLVIKDLAKSTVFVCFYDNFVYF